MYGYRGLTPNLDNTFSEHTNSYSLRLTALPIRKQKLLNVLTLIDY